MVAAALREWGRTMPYYESEQLFAALGSARERAAAVPDDIRAGVEELLTVALLAGIVPERVDRVTDVTVDCAPDVRPVIGSLIASLLARPRDLHRAIVDATRAILERSGSGAVDVAAEADAFANFSWEEFKQ
jgi:hypothetical protein